MRILIAEDEPLLQILAKRLMEHWGFDYDMASDGKEAVYHATANEGKYDLCLMDIDMPIINGLEAAKIIRRKLKYFPIMALTGNLEAERKYLAAGMDDFLEKPYPIDKLYRKINELTVKSIRIHKTQNQVHLKKELPMNPDELRELKELDKRGLTKFSLIDTNYKFITHKNLQNKISHDFIAKGKLLSEFLDRSPDDPGIIHLYAANLKANKRHILPEMLDKLTEKEDEDMKNYTEKAEFTETNTPKFK
jgi:CheY-like chemotaxis protein